MINISFDSIYVYILVLVRVVGVIAFNPIMSQKGVPVRIKMALVFMTTFLLAPLVPIPETITQTGTLDFFVCFGKELFIGFLFSYILNIYYYLLLGVGEILDLQFGLSMSKVFDPNTSIQMGITDKILNLLFVLFFFTSNTHLVVINIFCTSYEVIPVGAANINFTQIGNFAIDQFINAVSLVMRFTFPFIAAQFILEVSLGILMKIIPQIHVFVINMELKILLTIVLLIVLAAPIANFIDSYIVTMLENARQSLYVFASS